MRRGLAVLGASALLALALAWPGSAAPAVKGHLACGLSVERPASFCFVGDHLAAFFRTPGRQRVSYSVCVHKPNRSRDCRRERTGRRGRSRVAIGEAGEGKLTASWFADGSRVDSDRIAIQPRKVFVNGDSLAEGTRPYLPGALPGWHVEQSTAVSRHAPEGVALLRRRHVPPVIVMSLGTNDDPHTVDAFRAAVKETLRIAGKTRCVVWPNIVRPPVGGASYAGYNNVLDSENRHRRNLRVVDWARMVSKHRFWLADDGVHVNADGYKARATAIARQVERC
jgi:hypothetical protein